MEKIQQELATQIAGILSVEADAVDVNAPLHTLGLDSMRMVEIIVFIETNYGVDLMGSGLKREEVASIAALARTVESRQNS
jgi:acyl carrier protein